MVHCNELAINTWKKREGDISISEALGPRTGSTKPSFECLVTNNAGQLASRKVCLVSLWSGLRFRLSGFGLVYCCVIQHCFGSTLFVVQQVSSLSILKMYLQREVCTETQSILTTEFTVYSSFLCDL